MKESTRQFYLASMGISMWYSREALPGAAASPAMDFSIESPDPQPPTAPVHAPPAVPRAQHSGKKGLAQVRQALGPTEETEASEPVEPEVVEEAPVTEVSAETDGRETGSDESITVRAIVCVGVTLNLAAEFSTDMAFEAQSRLAGNLLRALGELDVESHAFQWPVFRNPRVPDNDSAGFDRVLSGLLGGAGGKHWLLLGGEGIEAMVRRIHSHDQKVWLHSERTLAGLAAEASAKRELWQLLKARLHESPLKGTQS